MKPIKDNARVQLERATERATERACACACASARLMEDVFDNL